MWSRIFDRGASASARLRQQGIGFPGSCASFRRSNWEPATISCASDRERPRVVSFHRRTRRNGRAVLEWRLPTAAGTWPSVVALKPLSFFTIPTARINPSAALNLGVHRRHLDLFVRQYSYRTAGHFYRRPDQGIPRRYAAGAMEALVGVIEPLICWNRPLRNGWMDLLPSGVFCLSENVFTHFP